MKSKKILALLLCLVGIVSCKRNPAVDPNISGGEIIGGSNWDDPWPGEGSNDDDTSDEFVCDHLCTICGKCLDDSLEDPKYADKCDSMEGRSKYTIIASEKTIQTLPGSKGGFVLNPDGPDNPCLGNVAENIGAQIIIAFNAEKDEDQACLMITASSRPEDTILNGSLSTEVNTVSYVNRGFIPHNDNQSYWVDYKEAPFGCIGIKQGYNELRMTVVGTGFNIRDFSILSSGKIEFLNAKETAITDMDIKLDKDILAIGDVATPTVSILPETISQKYTMESLNPDIATIEGDKIKAIKEGNAKIRFWSENKTFKKDISIQVVKEVIQPTSIEIEAEKEQISVSEELQLTATVLPENTTRKDVVWSVNDDTLASINNKGVLIGKDVGEVIVTATSVSDNNIKGTKTIKITQDKNRQIFEAENAVLEHAAKMNEATSNNPSGGGYVGQLSSATKVTFNITSEEDTSAVLSIRLALVIERNFDAIFTIKVNDVDIKIDNPNIEGDATGNWFNWVEKQLGTISLKKGENTIVLQGGTNCQTNLDALILSSKATLSWTK